MSEERPSLRERVSGLIEEGAERVRERRSGEGRRVDDTMSDLRKTLGISGGGPREVQPMRIASTFETGPVKAVLATREGVEIHLRANPMYVAAADKDWHFSILLEPSVAVAIAELVEANQRWAVHPPVADRVVKGPLTFPDHPVVPKHDAAFGEDGED